MCVGAGAVVVAIATSTSTSHAQTAAPSGPLAPIRAAWDAADFDQIPDLCTQALAHGGLSRTDVTDVYARLGASLAIAGKKGPALAAFRKAALVDPTFKVPPEAGKRALALAESARNAQAAIGALSLTLAVPDEIDSGSAFGVDVDLKPASSNGVAMVTLDARDATSRRAFSTKLAAAPTVHFDVPSRLTLPDASVVVRVRARDEHDNELCAAEKRVHVAHGAKAAAIASRTEPGASGGGSGFWGSAWPYVIGGAALAAAGGATAWYLTRPTDNVDVGVVRVQLVH